MLGHGLLKPENQVELAQEEKISFQKNHAYHIFRDYFWSLAHDLQQFAENITYVWSLKGIDEQDD